MNIDVAGWWSPATGYTMPVIRYGQTGRPAFCLGTGAGDVLDTERSGLVGAFRPFVEAGRVRVYTSVTAPPDGPSGWAAYARWFADELVPYIRHDVGDARARIAVLGVGDGAVAALRLFLARPDLCWLAICAAGDYAVPDAVTGESAISFAHLAATSSRSEWHSRGFVHLQDIGRHAETAALIAALTAASVPHHLDVRNMGKSGALTVAGEMIASSLDRFA